jgi:hypothetical protein
MLERDRPMRYGEGDRESTNVEDRRGEGGMFPRCLMRGINPLALLSGPDGVPGMPELPRSPSGPRSPTDIPGLPGQTGVEPKNDDMSIPRMSGNARVRIAAVSTKSLSSSCLRAPHGVRVAPACPRRARSIVHSTASFTSTSISTECSRIGSARRATLRRPM